VKDFEKPTLFWVLVKRNMFQREKWRFGLSWWDK